MSAATKIKIYGTVEGATGVNFVSSGTGSLTNDIVHVGASANGVYHIALAKADLSDASQAWYDEYIVILSATGAAYETFIIEGVKTDTSYLSAAISDILSAATQINSRVLLTQSAASDAASGVVVANSRLLLNQSRISDAYSMLSDFYSDFQSRVPKAVATNSQLSDLHSDLRSYLVVMSGALSDTYSLLSDANSDLASKIGAITATVSASDISDIASAVWATALATKLVTLNTSDMSDLRSAIAAGPAATITASDISDIASAVWANTIGARVDSRVLLNQSRISDIASYLVVMSGVQSDLYSLLSDVQSDFGSRVPKLVATSSQLSDLSSDLRSYLTVMSGVQSDIYSLLSDVQSDFQSRVPKRVATDSQLSDLHSDLRSYLVGMSGVQSDIYSLLSDVSSDLGVLSGVQSDIYSLLQDRFPATYTELASVPGAAPTLRQAVMLPYMFLRNSTEGTPSKRKVKTGAGTTITSATVSWDAGTSVFQQGALG